MTMFIVEMEIERLMSPTHWLMAAAVIAVAAARAYIPLGLGTGLVPLWWRGVERFALPVMRRLDRVGRTRADLGLRALLMMLVVVIGAGLIAQSGPVFDRLFGVRGLGDFLLLLSTMQVGGVWRNLRFSVGIPDGSLPAFVTASRFARAYQLGQFPDGFAVRRLMIAHLGIALDKMLLLPVVWFLLFGVTGALVVASLSAMWWLVRLHPPRSAFGDTVLMAERVIGFVPNWLAGVFLSLAALIAPKAGIARSLRAINPDHSPVSYELGGYPVATLAYGLHVVLGGPLVACDGAPLGWAWVGPREGGARPEGRQIALALYWGAVSVLILAGAIAMISLALE